MLLERLSSIQNSQTLWIIRIAPGGDSIQKQSNFSIRHAQLF